MRSMLLLAAGGLLAMLAYPPPSPAADHPVPRPGGGATAWGKPVDDLQAGLRCPKGKEVIRPGEEVELEVVVRNVGDRVVAFPYLRPRFWGTAAGSTVAVTAAYTGPGFPATAHIEPGGELLLGTLALGHPRPKEPGVAWAARPELPPGKYQVGSENVVVPVPRKGGGPDWRLGTGYLDIELRGPR